MANPITNATSGTSLLTSILTSSAPPIIGGSASSTGTSSTASSLAVTGLASGIDWSTVVSELAQAERTPEIQWQQQQSALNTQNSIYTTLKTALTTLQADIQALQTSSLYGSAAAQSSSSTVATATAASGATLGNFTFNISQLATAAQINGTTGVSQVISPTGDPGSVTVGTAGFSTPVTAGTFTVNGAQVTVASTDSLQQVFDNIATATNNTVTASYDSTTDKITLSSASAITLGSSADTSNFLQVAQLYNNQTGTITSNAALGHAQLGATMTGADLATAITDGGSGQGAFTINGVTINYDASSDSIQNVLSRINSSAAGVTASYDPQNDRFTLTDRTTGDVGISMQDVTGNFLAATGLSGGTLQSGKNLLYTLNGGSQQLVSQSNTISSTSSNITGLSVTALTTGSTSIAVSSDPSQLSTAIQKFVTDYNSVQTAISSNQIVSTSASGAVTPGPLTGDQTANGLANSLRSVVAAAVPGLSGAMNLLSDMGIQTNGQDNTLSVDTTTLNSAISNNLNSVQAFFTSATGGLATQMNTFLNNTIGANGSVTNHQSALTQQVSNLSAQITNLETKIANDSANWTSEFQAMEQAQSTATQELTYLSEQVTSGTL
jgi:flagellar hook-associated protein 2